MNTIGYTFAGLAGLLTGVFIDEVSLPGVGTLKKAGSTVTAEIENTSYRADGEDLLVMSPGVGFLSASQLGTQGCLEGVVLAAKGKDTMEFVLATNSKKPTGPNGQLASMAEAVSPEKGSLTITGKTFYSNDPELTQLDIGRITDDAGTISKILTLLLTPETDGTQMITVVQDDNILITTPGKLSNRSPIGEGFTYAFGESDNRDPEDPTKEQIATEHTPALSKEELHALGLCHLRRLLPDETTDTGLAVRYLQMAADAGHLDAQVDLGYAVRKGYYLQDKSVTPEGKKRIGRAIELWEDAALKGSPYAYNALGRSYAADAGRLSASIELPEFYGAPIVANGTPTSELTRLWELALINHKHAAQIGREKGLFEYVEDYTDCLASRIREANLPKEPRLTVRRIQWLRHAAEEGLCSLSMSSLSAAYSYGEGVPKDASQAYAWANAALQFAESSVLTDELYLGLWHIAEHRREALTPAEWEKTRQYAIEFEGHLRQNAREATKERTGSYTGGNEAQRRYLQRRRRAFSR